MREDTDSILLQFTNAEAPIEFTLFPMVNVLRDVHLENADPKIPFVSLPIMTVSIEEKPLNHESTTKQFIETFFRLLQLENTNKPMLVTPLPIVTEVKPRQPEKA